MIKRRLTVVITTLLFVVLSPAVFAYADAQRGYDALGGEVFFLFLPLLGQLVWRAIQE